MIDWSRLEELTAEIGADAIGEVIGLFLDEADGVVKGLRGAPPIIPAQAGADLHFLKGAALNLGFIDLAQMCDAGERAPERVDLRAIVNCYQRSKELFLSGIATRSAA